MAANNYYHNTQSYDYDQSLQPPIASGALPGNSSHNGNEAIYSQYDTPTRYNPSPAPSYRTNDYPRQDQHDYTPSQSGSALNEQYADDIPLKTDWRQSNTGYPPSPESQQERVGLVPHPTPMTKKGWFSGKIPWLVYIVSLVQISVFIAEIVKNCKCSLNRQVRKTINSVH